MHITDQILFFLAGLGVFNGVLLAFYFLIIKKPRRWIDILFGMLMMALCVRIGKSLFHYFMEIPIIYRQLGLSACIMIGPLTYRYVCRYLRPVDSPSRADLAHLTIPLVSIVAIGIIWPYAAYPYYWNYWIITLIYGSWLIYLIAAGLRLRPTLSKVLSQDGSIADYWLVIIWTSVSLLCIVYIAAYFGFPYLLGPVSFSVVLYLIVGFLMIGKNRDAILRGPIHKYQQNKLDNRKAEQLISLLQQEMDQNRPYLNSKIKLGDVAEIVNTTPHELSQVINDRLQVSFNRYINDYRIKYACELLQKMDHLSVEGIGKEVGFNSRSAFYTAFKSITEMTPAQYKAHFVQTSSS